MKKYTAKRNISLDRNQQISSFFDKTTFEISDFFEFIAKWCLSWIFSETFKNESKSLIISRSKDSVMTSNHVLMLLVGTMNIVNLSVGRL